MSYYQLESVMNIFWGKRPPLGLLSYKNGDRFLKLSTKQIWIKTEKGWTIDRKKFRDGWSVYVIAHDINIVYTDPRNYINHENLYTGELAPRFKILRTTRETIEKKYEGWDLEELAKSPIYTGNWPYKEKLV